MSDAAMAELADRLRARHDTIAQDLVARYRDEIVDYAASPEEFLQRDVLDVTSRLLDDVFDNIARAAMSPSEEQVGAYRRSLARRPHQGIALPSIQHAFRIFGEHVYAELAACASPDRSEELHAVIEGGVVVMRFAHEVISGITLTYLEELEDVRGDREIVGRSLLDALLAGRSAIPSTGRDARILGIELAPRNVVIVARAPAAEPDRRPRTLRTAARELREQLAKHLDGGPGLVGIREDDVVCLVPVPDGRALERATAAAHAAATTLAEHGVSVGVSSRHPSVEEVPAAYSEAREAGEIANRTGRHGRAAVYDDVLVDHVLRENVHAERVVASALGGLREYDRDRGAHLLDTLRAYIDANFSVTRAARALDLHSNTVVYRLDRIRRLTGRNPREPRDVMFLALALRLDGPAISPAGPTASR